MADVGTREIVGDVGVLTIDYPPVNALGAPTRIALDTGFRAFAADSRVKAIVLICAGRTFIAGGDITEFGKPSTGPSMLGVFDLIENGAKPVVAAIHGSALGGGYETALICHYRIAVPSARIGLPEVALGLMPGGGGTQRLPRIVGVPAALELIAGGLPVSAERALECGMIDALAEEGRLRADAIAFATRLVAEDRPLIRVRDRQDAVEPWRGKPEVYADYLARNARAFRGLRAPFAIAKAIEAAAELPFDEGMAVERELFAELMDSPESSALRYFFFAKRQAAKPDDPADNGQARPIDAKALARRVMGPGPSAALESLLDGPMPLDFARPEVARLLCPVVNAGAQALEDGMVARASDIDVACIEHHGWPAFTGGPMFWADAVGLPRVVEALRNMGLEPAPLLASKANSKGHFTR